jgi:hypothetical protein
MSQNFNDFNQAAIINLNDNQAVSPPSYSECVDNNSKILFIVVVHLV